jgi:hypothetical protein
MNQNEDGSSWSGPPMLRRDPVGAGVYLDDSGYPVTVVGDADYGDF